MPKDQWAFVPHDDEVREPLEEPAPEEAALHVDSGDELTSAEDPGRAEVDLAEHPDEAGPPHEGFDDEEPEDPTTSPAGSTDGETPDLEQLLEDQHYAFEPEPPE